MSEAILQEIIQVEKEAARLEEESKKQAREIVTEAKKQAADLLEKSISEGEAVTADILKQARLSAEMEIESRQKSSEAEAGNLRNTAERSMNQAVQYIVGRIVDVSGNH